MKKHQKIEKTISRKDALKKMGYLTKYSTLTALGTYILLNPLKAQSESPPAPGWSL